MNIQSTPSSPQRETNSHTTDTPWVRAYERLWHDPIADNDPRRALIAEEMRQLRAANNLQAGLEVIGWWYLDGRLNPEHRDADVRTAMRRLKASKRLSAAQSISDQTGSRVRD